MDMTKPAANPFQFGGPVRGEHYFPRSTLLSTVRELVVNGVDLLLMGPHHFGKTSFLLELFQDIEEEGYSCLLIDMYNITSHQDFLSQLLRALRGKANFKDKVKSWWQRAKRLSPQLNLYIDPVSGNPGLGFSLARMAAEDVKAGIQDVFEGLAALGRPVIVAIDEVQQISQLDDKGWLEGVLVTYSQNLENVNFIFTESRKSLVADTENDPLRPLYRSCQVIELSSLGEGFTEWVIGRFNTVGITSEAEAIDHLRSVLQDSPNYVQMVCFHLATQARTTVTIQDMDEALESVAHRNTYAYQQLLASLTLAQQRVLQIATKKKKTLLEKGRALFRSLAR